jgi:probable addiction module antidote protein
MSEKNIENKLMALALTMPKYDDFMAEQYRKDPEFARSRVQEEFKEYVETDDIRYLLSTLRKAAEAKGWSALSRETGLSRSLLYAALSGETDPRIGTVMKVLKALGVRVITNIIPLEGQPPLTSSMESGQNDKEALFG